MLRRIMLTLFVTAGLTGLYALYAWLVTPRLVRPVLAESHRPQIELQEIQAEPPLSNRENAERHLTDAPWAKEAKIQIPLTQGMLFSNNWRALDDSQELFEFRPFAMIWFDTPNEAENPETEPAKPPMTLISERGLVRFSKKFDPVNQKSGRVINGKLEGRIAIKGADGLSATGRDLFFDEKVMELHSTEPIEFTYQQHHGTADSGIIVKLLRATGPVKKDQMISVSGVQRVLLRGHVEMDLATKNDSVRVTCDEGFDFNLESRNASAKINVQVTRPTGLNEMDLLKGQFLDLFFVDHSEDSRSNDLRTRGDAPGIVPIDTSPKALGLANSDNEQDVAPPSLKPSLPADNSNRWMLKQLRMTGSRAELESQRNDVSAFMTSLIYDVVSRTVRLTDTKAVIVQHHKNRTELRCPEITLTQTTDGEIQTAHGQGPGWVRHHQSESDEIDFMAQWKSHFTLEPDRDTGLSILKLHGKAIARQPLADSGLSAETIHLWFEQPRTRNTLREKPAPGDSPRQLVNRGVEPVSDATPASEWRPKRMLAQDRVVMVSPQLRGQTPRLEVLFDEGSPKPSQLASKPGSSVRLASNKTAEPLELSADQIRVRVNMTNTEGNRLAAELSEVWTEGNVDVQQSHGDDSEPLHLTGQQLHLTSKGDNQQVVHVIGQPAVIRDRGFDVEGNDVFLDRGRNRTWIEGPGALRLPVKNDFDGRSLDTPSLLTIFWQEKMTFDGQTATFLNSVEAALNDSRLKCQEMEVSLTQRVLFNSNQGNVAAAEVRQVVCKDGVEIDHSQYADKELVELRHMTAAKVTLDQTSGETLAIGPGRLSLWRPGRGKRAALAPRALAQANRPLETESSNWEFTRVTFAGKTIGNLHERKSTFHDRVRIVYGPVSAPLMTIDPDNLPRDGGWMQCDSLTVLQIQDQTTKKNHVELRAEGDAKLEGRSFFAQADSISFDESKELYTLRAKGNREVTIWRRATPGGDDDVVSAKSIWFIPSQNKLKSDKTTGIRGSN